MLAFLVVVSPQESLVCLPGISRRWERERVCERASFVLPLQSIASLGLPMSVRIVTHRAPREGWRFTVPSEHPSAISIVRRIWICKVSRLPLPPCVVCVQDPNLTRRQVLEIYGEYGERQEKAAGPRWLNCRRRLIKPVWNLFHGEKGGKQFRLVTGSSFGEEGHLV